jgi:transcriptional regulator with XRE-family HTH domain
MNIKEKRTELGLSQQQLADFTGIPKDRIGKWEQGKGNPKSDDNKTLEDFFASFTAEQVPRGTSHKEKHIITRNHLKEVGESKKGIQVYESAPVQAGIRTVYHDEHAVPDYVLNIPQFRDCNYGTRASGDSMYPEVRNGDLIVCKELPINARIIYGDMYVIHTKDGIETIKYVQQFVDSDKNEPWVLLVPHNKAAGMGTPIPRNEIIKLFKVRAIFKAY